MKILSKIKKRNVNRLLDTNLFFNYQDSKANPPSNKTSELQAKKKSEDNEQHSGYHRLKFHNRNEFE